MTKKEFKAAMLRGLGRCVKAVEQEPEKYRDIVLWACKRNIAYDAQSEGTRSWYVYTMANAYPDKETFIAAAAEALKKYHPRGGWDLLFLSDFLQFFAMDGYESAKLAVEEKYQEILDSMLARKRRRYPIFHELSDIEQLGLVLTVDRKSFLQIAGDFGRLYREKTYLEDGDFGWYFADKGKQYRKTMEAAAKKDANIACFMQRERAYIVASEEQWRQRQEKPQERLTGSRLSRWLTKKADQQTMEEYALKYRHETNPELRTKALEVFSNCPYPDDPQPILEDTCAECEPLRNAAWRVLENLRHPAVRGFAMENVSKGIRTLENFSLLVTNYEPEDAFLMETLLREMIATEDWDDVHDAGMDIGRAFYEDSVIPHPKHLLPLMYTYTPCSFCRESAVNYMSRHRMLTEEMLEECLYDSNYDIRCFAAKRRKK